MYKSVAVLFIAAAAAVGCSSSSTGSTPASAVGASAKAHAQALATSPAVLHAEKKVAGKVVTCAASKGVTLTIVNAGTPQMKVMVTHVSGSFMLHPVHSVEAIGTCMGLTPASVATLKSFTKTTIATNGLGSGSGTKDFTAIVNEIAQLS